MCFSMNRMISALVVLVFVTGDGLGGRMDRRTVEHAVEAGCWSVAVLQSNTSRPLDRKVWMPLGSPVTPYEDHSLPTLEH